VLTATSCMWSNKDESCELMRDSWSIAP
jgi:hypothetical protein